MEAHRVDELFEVAFEHEERSPIFALNHHLWNILTPCAILPVRLYSDARNVLTGIIDSPEHRRQLKEDFIDVLVWVLVQRCYQKSKTHRTLEKTAGPKRESSPAKSPDVLSRVVEKPSSLKDADGLSLDSVEDWTDDSNLFDADLSQKTSKEVAPPAGIPRPFFSLPGSIEIHTTEDERSEATSLNKLYKTVVFGLPAVDTGKQWEVKGMSPVKFSNPYSELLSIPEEWRTAPLPVAKVHDVKEKFPEGWFHFVLRQLDFSYLKDSPSRLLEDLIKDVGLKDLYIHSVVSCYIAMFESDNAVPSPGHIFRAYNGSIPWSDCSNWLIGQQELFQLALKAFR